MLLIRDAKLLTVLVAREMMTLIIPFIDGWAISIANILRLSKPEIFVKLNKPDVQKGIKELFLVMVSYSHLKILKVRFL